jgi:beta-phosphoglucomutase-like phosphatase (HAD superfamily)
MSDRHEPSKPTVLASGFLFDLDGVLTDSTKTVERHWHAFAMTFRLDPADVLQDVHGRRASDVTADLEARVLMDSASA